LTFWYDSYYDYFYGPYTGRDNWNIEKLHQKYGPVVRKSPDVLSIEDNEFFEVLFNSGRRDKWNISGKAASGSIQSTLHSDLHKKRRGALMRFFSKRSVLKLEPVIVAKVEQLSAGVERHFQTGRVLHAGTAFAALTLDVITDYCFDQSFDCLSDPDFSPEWKETMTALFDFVPYLKTFGWTQAYLTALPSSLLENTAPTVNRFTVMKAANRETIQKLHDNWQASNAEKHDSDRVFSDKPNRTIFYDILDSQVLPPEEKTVDRLADEAFGMVVAGGDTVGRALSNLFYHLHMNPVWLHQIRAEIDTAMPSPTHLASLSDLENLPIFTAAIKETLRVSNLITERLVLLEPEETLVYNNWVIPPKTPICMSLCSMHNDPNVFPNPKAFNPGRWIEAKQTGQNLDKYYVPFAKGSRSCLGVK
jgi:cytochrome P450